MTSLVIAYDLDHALGVWPSSVNRSERTGHGVRYSTDEHRNWRGYVMGGVLEEMESWSDDVARALLTAEGFRVEYEWCVWAAHHDLDNWFKSTTDAIWRALVARGNSLGIVVCSDRHITYMRGERLLPPKRRAGEPKHDYLIATISPRVQRRASREMYDVLAAQPSGPVRNSLVEKLSA